jgi:hypothetical protein
MPAIRVRHGPLAGRFLQTTPRKSRVYSFFDPCMNKIRELSSLKAAF